MNLCTLSNKVPFVSYDTDKRQVAVRMMFVRRLQILRFCLVYHLKKVILILQPSLQFKISSEKKRKPILSDLHRLVSWLVHNDLRLRID